MANWSLGCTPGIPANSLAITPYMVISGIQSIKQKHQLTYGWVKKNWPVSLQELSNTFWGFASNDFHHEALACPDKSWSMFVILSEDGHWQHFEMFTNCRNNRFIIEQAIDLCLSLPLCTTAVQLWRHFIIRHCFWPKASWNISGVDLGCVGPMW